MSAGPPVSPSLEDFHAVIISLDSGTSSNKIDAAFALRGLNELPALHESPILTGFLEPGTGRMPELDASGAPTGITEVAVDMRADGFAMTMDLATLPGGITVLEQSLALLPDPRLHLHVAALRDCLYQWPEAQRHCTAAIRLLPSLGSAAVSIAGACLQRDDPAAEAWLDRAEGSTDFLAGDYFHVFEERGVTLLRQARLVEAIDSLHVATGLAPWVSIGGDRQAAESLAKALSRYGRTFPVAI